MTEIPRSKFDESWAAPSWIPCRTDQGPAKPVIRCACGKLIGLKLHHVHADGTVTASFFHAMAEELQRDAQGYFFLHNGKRYGTEPGCGWHVSLKLQGWNSGDFPDEE